MTEKQRIEQMAHVLMDELKKMLKEDNMHVPTVTTRITSYLIANLAVLAVRFDDLKEELEALKNG